MTTATTDYRLDGIYKQLQEGFFMQRVKLAAGVISADQARTVAAVSSRFGQGTIHLTTRGSMEIHWLQETDLPEVKRVLSMVGLTSRGACGGAVRGVTCSSQGAIGFPAVEALARRIHRHFTANPRFERLPKKFKIGVEADVSGRRHLIQDAGLVLSGSNDGECFYDLYVAGGLGREPQTAVLFEHSVSENRVIPLIEAIARVYAAHTPAGKRLKHLLRQIGETEFRRLVAQEPSAAEELPPVTGLPDFPEHPSGSRPLLARIYAGQLTAEQLVSLADFADRWADGILLATADQDIRFHISTACDPAEASSALSRCGFDDHQGTFRICPGNHLCRVGLSPTRDIARTLSDSMGPTARTLTWAISGCPNSCTQPQLADVGIVSSSLVKDDTGNRTPRFDICHGNCEGLGTVVEHSLTLKELCCKVREMN
jgi:ferredoxin-nitrite reductase